MLAAVWIWPKLRSPGMWFGLLLLTILGTTVWLGPDLYQFVETRGWSQAVALRTLFRFISDVDKPMLQLILGTLLAALFSWRFAKPNLTDSSPPLAAAQDEKPGLAD